MPYSQIFWFSRFRPLSVTLCVVCQELSWAERKHIELPGVRVALKQQTKNERVKPFITYCDGKGQSLKPDKTLTLPIPFSPMERCTSWWSAESMDMGVVSLLRKPQQKALVVLWTLGWGGVRGKARSGEVLGTESEWGEVSSRFLLLPALGGLGWGAWRRALPKASDKET